MSILLQASNCLLLSTDLKKTESHWRDDPYYKFIYSIKGSMQYQSKRNEFSLNENEFIIFNPHDEHKQILVDNHKFLIELDSKFLNEMTASVSFIRDDLFFAQSSQKHPLIMQWVLFVNQYMQLEGPNGSRSSEIFLEHSFAQLGLLLVKTTIGSHTTDMNMQPFQEIHPALFKVMNALKNDFQHTWSLREMAAILDISKFQFAHLFKEFIGVSPYSWLQLYRIVRSQDLLVHTNRTITDISTSCGFSSIAVYNQLFKRLYGFPPSFFRGEYTKQIEK
ncbi:AraC family transcriptional regulator [Sporosarcina sp. resist]|uniref:AraC family transcriptional regulator n=1 Tax=Sporosarcina sp. resist TaxID=2762563 RepID=UPI00164E8D5D|nr:AraC family transcriptional regulator [Sporosarcina sp. resist]QNK86238.1 AraC family transcriptional regulator [Sporosarcina sp. resist]